MDAGLPSLAAAAAVPSVLLLLFVGHVLGDFGLQTRWMVDGKRRPLVLGAHAAVVSGVHFAVLLPHAGWPLAVPSMAIGIAHAAIDWTKTVWPMRRPGPLGLVLLLLLFGTVPLGSD